MRWIGVVVLSAVALWPAVAVAQQSPRDQHATAETINCLAKQGANYPAGYCASATPVPTDTATPRPEPSSTPHPTDTPAPDDPPTATATPLPCWWIDDELGDPDSGGVVYGITADGETVPYPLLDDQGQQWREPCPTATPTDVPSTPQPVPTRVPPPTATPVPLRPSPAPAPRAAQAPPAPVVIVVTATPLLESPVPETPVPSRTPTVTASATTTRTATATSTSTPLPTATATAEALVEPPSALPRLPFDWTGVFVVLAVLGSTSGLLTWLIIRQRRQHLARLAELGD